MPEIGEGSPRPENLQRKTPVNVEKRYIESAGSKTGRILRRLEMAARNIGLRWELIAGPDEEAIKRQVWEEEHDPMKPKPEPESRYEKAPEGPQPTVIPPENK